jgi:ABC-type Fe3+ transport system permease subunit
MRKSGAKLIGVGILLFVVGVPLAYLVDVTKEPLRNVLIFASIILCIGGAAVFLYGLVKLAAGLVKRA